MNNRIKITISLIALGVFVWSCGSDDPAGPGDGNGNTGPKTVILTPSKDNTLYEETDGLGDTLFSNGAGQQMFVGKTAGALGGGGDVPRTRRALMAFDVAARVPAGSTIDSVCLELTAVKAPNTDTTGVTLHLALQDWGESTSLPLPTMEGAGDSPDPGDCTWLHTSFPTAFWLLPGGDFASIVSSSTAVHTAAQKYKWPGTPQMVADVQNWLNNPPASLGWLLRGAESPTDSLTVKGFGTRENTTAANRPKLTVYYTEP